MGVKAMINREGDPLWIGKKRYKCGCVVIEGQPTCPKHGEPILEQKMIYGNKTDEEYLNERERYEKQNLNE
jgi:hypothetical protein